MTILNKDRLVRFGERLYQKKMPRLFKEGAGDLNPIKKSKRDPEGRTIISTREIITFFVLKLEGEKSPDADEYFESLYLLFEVLSKNTENYIFESDVRIAEKDIQEADNKKTIEYLTTNLIISYFVTFKDAAGADGEFLEKDLKKIIIKGNEGRDYKTLVGNTLKTLIKTLQEGKAWRECLEDIKVASLVCRLVGARLPQIDKNVLSKIVLESRKEINQYLAMFVKIRNTRDQVVRDEKNQKIFLKTMNKLDTANTAVLDKIDKYLADAHAFIQSIGASPKSFLGQNDSVLKQCIAKYFFEFQESNDKKTGINLNYSTYRFKMGSLFGYPDLTKYASTIQKEEIYKDCILNIYDVHLKEIIKQIRNIIKRAAFLNTKSLETVIFESNRLINKFDLNDKCLENDKQRVQQKYLTLIRQTPVEKIKAIIELREQICNAIQDDSRELLENTRKVLVDSCYASLISIDSKSFPADELTTQVRKIVRGYSFHYKPQRFFYQQFFELYIGKLDEELSEFFTDIMQTKKILGMAMLTYFSDHNHVKGFLSDKQIEYAGRLFKNYQEQKK